LSTEEQFYLVVPLIMLLPRAPRLTLWIALLAINLLVALGTFDAYIPPAVLTREILDVTFSPMFIGVLCAELLAAPEATSLAEKLAHPATGVAALVALAYLILAPKADISGAWRTAIHLAMSVVLMFVALRPDTLPVRAMEVAALRRIGVVSYGIYLWHMVVHNRVLTLERVTGLHHPLTQFLVMLLLTWLVAEISYRVIERRFLLMKDKLSKR
jgi:peptidoglycan/LPS O-acetylase OafA/YrhL